MFSFSRLSSSDSNLAEPLLQPARSDVENTTNGSTNAPECRILVETASTITIEEENSNKASDLSRNVPIVLIYTWLIFAGRSIWNQNVLATYVYLLQNGDAKAIGFTTSAMGMTQLILSFPTGYLADKYRRDTMLKIASVMGIISIAITNFALTHASYYHLVMALCAWGAYWGVADTSVSALYADSIRDGQRAHYFTKRSIVINLANLAGPAVALFVFLSLGNKWTIHACSKVMSIGQLVCLPAVFLSCCLNDDLAVKSTSSNNTNNPEYAAPQIEDTNSSPENADLAPLLECEEEHEDVENTISERTGQNNEEANDCSSICRQSVTEITASTTTSATSSEDEYNDITDHETFNNNRLSTFAPFLPKHRAVAILIATADVTAGLASGMSIRYFSIFLFHNLKMSPVNVQIQYIMVPLVQASLMRLAEYLATKLGRCRVAVMFKWIGIALMYAMVLSYVYHFPVWVTCTILLFRSAFMNSTSALTKSVLMDNIPTEERAKWSSLESLNMFSWSGSAALGGILVNYRGILFNFCITALLQFFATMPLLFLSFFSNKQQKKQQQQ